MSVDRNLVCAFDKSSTEKKRKRISGFSENHFFQIVGDGNHENFLVKMILQVKSYTYFEKKQSGLSSYTYLNFQAFDDN